MRSADRPETDQSRACSCVPTAAGTATVSRIATPCGPAVRPMAAGKNLLPEDRCGRPGQQLLPQRRGRSVSYDRPRGGICDQLLYQRAGITDCLKPVLRILRQATLNQLSKGGWRPRWQLTPVRLAFQEFHQRVGHCFAFEHGPGGKHFEQHDGRGPSRKTSNN
jgi:hypothetical protein